MITDIDPTFKQIKPRCQYFGRCGGCDLQMLGYADQLKFKNKIVTDLIENCKLKIKNYSDIIPGSNSEFYYRNSIRFEFLRVEGRLKIARHNYLDSAKPVVTDFCLLQSEFSNQLLNEILALYNDNGYDGDDLWQVKIREGKTTNEFMLEMITKTTTMPLRRELVNLTKKYMQIKSVYQTIAPDKDIYKLSRRLLDGRPVIFEKIGKYTFQISPESFFQTNSLGVETLYNVIKDFADVKIGDTVVDLFCGTGSIGIYLSTLAKKVTGIEIVPEAIRDARDNAKINKISNCEFICSDISNLSSLIFNLDNPIVVVDPPRAGLSKELIFLLSTFNFRLLVYVSCNPETFFRDLKLFQSRGITIEKIQPIDMFPQTHHIELVALLNKDT